MGEELPVRGIVTMCAPIQAKSVDDLYLRVLQYVKSYKKLEEKDEEQIIDELKELELSPMTSLKNLQEKIVEKGKKLNTITSPALVLQGSLDDTLYKESAPIIYDKVRSTVKELKWYEQSGHIITLGKEREQVYEDICIFLDSLNWLLEK